MEPEVRLVEVWLHLNNYLTRTNVKSGAREIDILGVQVKEGRLGKKCHVEVSCWSGGKLQGTKGEEFNSPSDVANYFIERKFEKVRKKVESILGPEYDKVWVINSLMQFNNQRNAVKQECLKKGVEVKTIKEIAEKVKDRIKSMKGSRDWVVRTIELLTYAYG